jgi:predicted dehydrogenase
MKKLKVGIIGQGRSGRDIHGRCLVEMTDKYEIAAVADLLEDRRKRAETEYGCTAYEDYHSLFERKDLDLIINSIPSYLHVPVTLEILNNGFNVVCEKPLARKASEVDTLIKTAEKSGKLFAIFQQSRFSPVYRKIREIIDSGVIGRIVQISSQNNGFARRWDWQTLQENNGGSLLNTGPHPVDQVLQLFGTDVMPEVTCIMDRANTFGDAEDYVKVILHGPGRPVIDVEISSCCTYTGPSYNIQGTRGGIKATSDRVDWKFFKAEEAPEQHLIRTPLMKADGTPAYCSEQLKWHEDSWEVPEDQKDTFQIMSKSYYNMIYSALTEGTPLEITPMQVRQQIAVMEECHRQNPLSRLSE